MVMTRKKIHTITWEKVGRVSPLKRSIGLSIQHVIEKFEFFVGKIPPFISTINLSVTTNP